MNAVDRTTIIQQATLMEQQGLRVLACACSKTDSDLSPLIANAETGMYVTFFTPSIDPVKTLNHFEETRTDNAKHFLLCVNTIVVFGFVFRFVFRFVFDLTSF